MNSWHTAVLTKEWPQQTKALRKKTNRKNSAAIFTIACGLWTTLRAETTLCKTVFVKGKVKISPWFGCQRPPSTLPAPFAAKKRKKKLISQSYSANIPFFNAEKKNERQTNLLLLLYSQNILLEIPRHTDERFPVPTHRYGRAAGKNTTQTFTF